LIDYYLMMLGAVCAGLGYALVAPITNAFYLDITAKEHRSQIVGIKGSFPSFVGVLGPLAVAAVAGILAPQSIFWIASGLTLVALALGVVFLKEPKHLRVVGSGLQDQIANQRSLAAQANLQNIAMLAFLARAEMPKGMDNLNTEVR
jgi:MFS family permease